MVVVSFALFYMSLCMFYFIFLNGNLVKVVIKLSYNITGNIVMLVQCMPDQSLLLYICAWTFSENISPI